MLRMLLARYMAVDLNALLFGRETNGRPCLQLADAPDSNFSDTGGGTVLAFGSGGRVGIDNGCWVRTTPTARLAAGLRPMRPKRCLGWRRNSRDVRFFDCGRRKKLRYRAPEQHLRPLAARRFAIDEAALPVALYFPPDAEPALNGESIDDHPSRRIPPLLLVWKSSCNRRILE